MYELKEPIRLGSRSKVSVKESNYCFGVEAAFDTDIDCKHLKTK